jgi:aspartate aminotransferase-like enzyme
MLNHSIAPWKTVYSYSDQNIRDIKDAQGEIIAFVCDLEKYSNESISNAQLIAAAPDLLAALREYVERHEADGDPAGLPEYELACAAIAKALGNQTEK